MRLKCRSLDNKTAHLALYKMTRVCHIKILVPPQSMRLKFVLLSG